MIVSYNWLKEYVEIPWSAHELAQRLTMSCLPVDRVEALGEKWSKIVVAEVVKIQKHPQASSLVVCEVTAGKETIGLVCGATNLKTRDKVPLALPDTVLPDGKTIEKSIVHGLESAGMLCSEAELELGTDNFGIMILDSRAKVGQSLTESLQLEDWAIELDVTPNRPDCLSIYGVAREISALTGNPLKKIEPKVKEGEEETKKYLQIELENTDDCPRYLGRIIRNVEIKPSPSWLARKLFSVGQRPVNNIVDITNFVMLELGQPLHPFDFELFTQKKVLVRRAKQGEVFTTLDGIKRVLGSEVLLITDGRKPVALAGIMGGQESEVSQNAKTILLESAYFSPPLTRQGRKKVGLSTEASSRFERGTDPNLVATAADRAAALMVEIAGGEVLKSAVDLYPKPILPQTIKLRPERVNQFLDTTLPTANITIILEGLEFEVAREESALEVTVPTFRPDVTQEADLIEEIARIYGYDNIPVAAQNKGVLEVKESLQENMFAQIRAKLTGWGFQEVVTYSLVDPGLLEIFGDRGNSASIMNPITSDQSVLRTNLGVSMLSVILNNQNRRQTDLKLFEIGKVYFQDSRPKENYRLCLALTGMRRQRSWDTRPDPVDFFDLKGAVQALAETLGLYDFKMVPCKEACFSDPYSLQLECSLGVLGRLGSVGKNILEKLDINNQVFLAEIEVEKLATQAGRQKLFQPLPKYPAVDRDLAIIVDKSIPAAEIMEKIRDWTTDLAEEVGIFDLYQGKQVPPDKKSLAFYIRYRSPDRTLTDQEVNQAQEKVIQNLQKEFKAELRS